MKRKGIKIKWSRFFLLALIMLFFYVKPVLAGNYLGEFCWRINDSIPENYIILKFAVSDVGGGHYSLNGTFIDYENNVAQENPDVGHGNAELVDSMIVMTLVNSYYVPSEEYGSSVLNIQLNPSTLSGTYRTIDTAYQFSSSAFTQEFGDGAIEFLPNCE
jgi:hypothetical protein